MWIIILKFQAQIYLTSDTSWTPELNTRPQSSRIQMVTEARTVLCPICASGSKQTAEVDLRQVSGRLLTATACARVFVRVCERVRTASKGTNHGLWLEQWRDTLTQMIVNSADGEETRFRLDSLTVQKRAAFGVSKPKYRRLHESVFVQRMKQAHRASDKIDTSIHPSQTRTHLLSSIWQPAHQSSQCWQVRQAA